MVVKNMDIWAISGNNTIEVGNINIKRATRYTLYGNHIITTVQVDIFNQKELSLHLHTSIFDITKCIDEYK